jgi:type IV secretory pathway VirB2 component (pilin)
VPNIANGLGKKIDSHLTIVTFDSSIGTTYDHLQPHEETERMKINRKLVKAVRRERVNRALYVMGLLLFIPAIAHAQGTSPFDTGFNNISTLFTGTIAKVASLVAIVVGGYGFAHGEPGAKKNLAGIAAGTGIAVLAANVLTWLWGI